MSAQEVNGCYASIRRIMRCKWFFPVLSILVWALFAGATCVNWASDTTTDWVQAIGSILAIVAAFVIAGAQSRLAAAQTLERQRIKLALLANMVDRAFRQAIQLEQMCERGLLFHPVGAVDFAKGSLEGIWLELKDLDVSELGDLEIAEHVITLRAELGEGLRRYRLFTTPGFNGNDPLLRGDIKSNALKAQGAARWLMEHGKG